VKNANSRPILYLFWIGPSTSFCIHPLLGSKYAVCQEILTKKRAVGQETFTKKFLSQKQLYIK